MLHQYRRLAVRWERRTAYFDFVDEDAGGHTLVFEFAASLVLDIAFGENQVRASTTWRDIHQGFLDLAAALICWRRLSNRTR